MANARIDYYQILGIEKTASPVEIKRAYRKLMMTFHPDKYRGKAEEGLQQTKAIVAAYEILSDDDLKRRYDMDETNFVPSNNFDGEEKPNFQRPRKARDPNAPLEIGFDFQAFMDTLGTLAWTRDQIAFENYVIENINDVQAFVKTAYLIKDIFYYLQRMAAFHLITAFDADWLKGLENFNRASFLGEIFNTFYVNNGISLLNHLGRDWIQSRLNGEHLKALMGNLTGNPGDDIKAYRDIQVQAILDFLGQDWLRELFKSPYQLGMFLQGGFYYNCEKLTLKFIDGDDHWLAKTINTGSQLGIVLDKMTVYQENYQGRGMLGMFSLTGYAQPSPPPQLREFVLPDWKTFLAYLDPQWPEKIANHPTELNALLHEIDKHYGARHKTLGIKLFLDNFFDNTKIATFAQFIAIFKPTIAATTWDEVENSQIEILNVAKSLPVVQVFSDKQMHQIIFAGKSLAAALINIDAHKAEPYYQALLLAATKAYYHARDLNPNDTSSLWGKVFGHTQLEKLAAAQSLMQAIIENQPVDAKVAGINSGKLSELSRRYAASRKFITPEAEEKSSANLNFLMP